MKRTLGAVGVAVVCLTWGAPARGMVLCMRKSGAVMVRDTCKKKETLVDPVALGLQGARGDAGPRGDVGPQGELGPKGDAGPQGPPGPASLPCASQVGTDVFFTGCNVHIRSGSGTTDAPVNGLGNLIVGYNANTLGQNRSGSHNLIVGDEHGYPAYGGLIAGWGNTVTFPFGSVSGGDCNVAGPGTVSQDCLLATTSGSAPAPLAPSVSGGRGGLASGPGASISGGTDNIASGIVASVSGGAANQATGLLASICGGHLNVSSGWYATVVGGLQNVSTGQYAVVSGGLENQATGYGASVSGGACNTAGPAGSLCVGSYGGAASVSGGSRNAAYGNSSSISGGRENIAGGDNGSVSGGMFVHASGDFEWHAGQTAGFPTGTVY